MDADLPEPPLTVPRDLEREHLTEARRIVARSHRRPLVRSRPRSTAPATPRARAQRAVLAIHGVGLLLVVLLAVITGIWGIATAMAGAILVSLLVMRRLVAAMFTPPNAASDPTRLRTDRPG